MRLIDADALLKTMEVKCPMENDLDSFKAGMRAVLERICEAPTVDAVPVKSIEQLKWERDTAIQQLEEHGIPFCGKADVVDVVRCKDCKYWERKDGLVIGYCGAAKHGYKSTNWDIGIYRMTMDTGYCSDGERKDDVSD